MASRPSYAQVELLVEFLEENPGIAKGLLRTTQAKSETKRKWDLLASSINAIGGANKSGQGWAKYWAEKKCALKKQCAQINASNRRTGGGVGSAPQLSAIDKRLVAVMGGEDFASGDTQFAVQPFPQLNLALQVEESSPAESGAEIQIEQQATTSAFIAPAVPDAPSAVELIQDSPQTSLPRSNRHRSQIPRRQRLSRTIDVEMDRLAQVEERRVEAEVKTAEAFAEVASSLQSSTEALNNIASAIMRVAVALENITLK